MVRVAQVAILGTTVITPVLPLLRAILSLLIPAPLITLETITTVIRTSPKTTTMVTGTTLGMTTTVIRTGPKTTTMVTGTAMGMTTTVTGTTMGMTTMATGTTMGMTTMATGTTPETITMATHTTTMVTRMTTTEMTTMDITIPVTLTTMRMTILVAPALTHPRSHLLNLLIATVATIGGRGARSCIHSTKWMVLGRCLESVNNFLPRSLGLGRVIPFIPTIPKAV